MSQYQAILGHIPAAMLVVFRIGGLMIFGPVFGAPVIPVRVKVFLAFLIGAAVYPTIAAEQLAPAPLPLDLFTLAPLAAMELLIGLLVGYLAAIPMISVQTGGLLMGQQMGLGFARFYNPGMDAQADIVGQVLFFMALAGFLAIGGHEAMMAAVLRSFQYVPPGQVVLDMDIPALLSGMLLAALELALRIAAPVLTLVFLESLAMGYMAKTVPQLNILSLGFPLRILAGFAMIILALAVMNDVIMDGIDGALNEIFLWVEGSGK